MNYKMVLRVLGKTMLIEAVLLIVPMIVGYGYGENNFLSFVIPIAVLAAVGFPLSFLKGDSPEIYAKEGFVIVAACWIVLSLVGALPFVISGEIPNYIDAVFETVSGFTTTGASILSDVESMSKALMFWRILTHWLGGMGVLVFVLAIIPSGTTGSIYLFRAESPGPSSGKLVGKIRHTALILYGIYVALTAMEAILLYFSGIGWYDSVLNAFSTAGTGGFGIYNNSIAAYNSAYVEIVISVFMFLFGVNFTVFYLILTGSVLKAIKSEEFIVYAVMVFSFTIIIAVDILSVAGDFWNALRLSFFQVNTISSTTGFSTANFDDWPGLSKAILLFLTVVGASGGSTGGGLKVARMCILAKNGAVNVRRMAHSRSVVHVKFEGKTLDKETNRNVITYFILYVAIVCFVTVLLSFDSFAGNDIFSNFSATLACISNVGPGFNAVGPSCSYGGYSAFSKIVLSLVMLAGRLEIFPILILFLPRTWKKGIR